MRLFRYIRYLLEEERNIEINLDIGRGEESGDLTFYLFQEVRLLIKAPLSVWLNMRELRKGEYLTDMDSTRLFTRLFACIISH